MWKQMSLSHATLRALRASGDPRTRDLVDVRIGHRHHVRDLTAEIHDRARHRQASPRVQGSHRWDTRRSTVVLPVEQRSITEQITGLPAADVKANWRAESP